MHKFVSLFIVVVVCCGAVGLQAQSQGQQYFVFLNSNPDRDSLPEAQVQKLQKGHLANITRLAEEGIILGAGPFYNGGGIFIMEGDSLGEIRNILSTDPAISADRFLLEVFPLTLSSGKICDVPENYTMGTYQFVRFRPATQSKNRLDLGGLAQSVTEADSLVVTGNFGAGNGGFALFNKVDSTGIGPLVKSHTPANYSGEMKKLWIARETFCLSKKIQ